MLRANLYKKFSKSNLPKAVDGVKQSDPSIEPMSLDRMMYPSEEINSKGLSVTPTKQPDLRSINLTGTAPLPNFGVKSSFMEGMSNPEMAVRGADPGTRKVQTPQGEVYVQPGYVDSSEVDKAAKTKTQLKTPLDYNSMFTLGLGAVDMGLGYNEDLKNQRILNESIQNRQSKPLYDYNYMYGRTTSGGTEYQPTIKAEMGAHITKRYNSPYGPNNVEVEGGEFIQLPNFDTEHAEGPSHEKGGIKTSLPEGTRVYSDHLKPDGSKKTFAQLAKKYDISSFQKTLDDPFKKQVDKDTATIMLKRNQKMLDDLFAHQQSMNGNSNGEMRDGGIHNPGFQALPKAVQDQIISNMEYGGYQLPEYAIGGDTKTDGTTGEPSKAGMPKNLQSYVKWDSKAGKTGRWRLEVPENLPVEEIRKITEAATAYGYNDLMQTSNQRLTGTGASKYKGFYAGLKPQDFERKLVEGELGPDETNKLTESQIREKAFGILGIDANQYDLTNPEALYNDPQFAKTFYKKFTGLLPESKFRTDRGDDVMMGFEHLDALKNKNKPTTSDTPKVEEKVVTPPNFTGAKGVKPGNYNKMNFPLAQAIPNVYGLAEAQTTYAYAIPEIDSPYIKPQTLNIQSQLQDIDNMGTAAVRSGADPLSSYIAGLDAKQKSFQTKQNYDAEGRSRADVFNAQAKTQTDMFNAEAFDKNYNERNALAKAYQSQEKTKQLANAIDKYSAWDKTEGSKKFLYDNFVTSFDLDRAQNDAMTVAGEPQPFYVGNPVQTAVNDALNTKTEGAKTKKSTKGAKLGATINKKTSLNKYKK